MNILTVCLMVSIAGSVVAIGLILGDEASYWYIIPITIGMAATLLAIFTTEHNKP